MIAIDDYITKSLHFHYKVNGDKSIERDVMLKSDFLSVLSHCFSAVKQINLYRAPDYDLGVLSDMYILIKNEREYEK